MKLKAGDRLKRILLPLAVTVFFMGAGLLIIRSQAATAPIMHEAENGTRDYAANCTDATASGGAAVKFSARGSCDNSLPKYTHPMTMHEPGGNPVYHKGYYYMPVKCGSETVIRMVKARWIKDFAYLKDCATIRQQKVVWNGAGTSAGVFLNWPVLMTRLQNKWYIYMNASASTAPFSDRLQVLEANTDDPMGSWTLKTSRLGENTWNIGFSPFEWNGRLYIIVSNREGHTPGTHHALAIASLSNPWTASSTWRTLTDPTLSWETWSERGINTAPINEVDQPIIYGGKLHIMYSASHVNSTMYTSSYITYDGSGDLLDRANWRKFGRPVFTNTASTKGAGQTFSLKSPDGSKYYIGYAYWRTPTVLSPRPLGLVPISFDAANNPIFPPLPNAGTQFEEPPK